MRVKVLCFNFRPTKEKDHDDAVILCFGGNAKLALVCIFSHHYRINKLGSQKDQEQKKSGNYFFYDDGAGDEDEDIDDLDL